MSPSDEVYVDPKVFRLCKGLPLVSKRATEYKCLRLILGLHYITLGILDCSKSWARRKERVDRVPLLTTA
jgi:hypothetical protein